MSFLTVNEASYCYQGNEAVVDRVQWSIAQGEFHCLVGRSGCGKTTLLKIAAGLLQPTSGSIFIDDTQVVEPSDQVGFVFQAPTLLEWLPVTDNVLLPISLKRRVTAKDYTRAAELLELVGLGSFTKRHPQELSGGQQSRVAIARALIREPAFLMLDEPFAALDAITRAELQDDLLRLCEHQKTTVLFVTHDIAEAAYLGDFVTVMSQGELQQAIPIDLAKPRAPEIRYDSTFNALCLKIRKTMDGTA
ncbi:MAG: ABC transporter ATP-binding protein [Alphaproteobacteria bacterium]|jgi:NitT/TauT family transport system ATP-binding protein